LPNYALIYGLLTIYGPEDSKGLFNLRHAVISAIRASRILSLFVSPASIEYRIRLILEGFRCLHLPSETLLLMRLKRYAYGPLIGLQSRILLLGNG
jgi:hypothetical protein